MRSLFLYAVICFSSLFPHSLFAGHDRGNGGDGVVCRDEGGNITSVELLDFYEVRNLMGKTIDLGPTSLSAIEKATLAVTRLPNFEHKRKDLYLRRIQTFLDPNETSFVPHANLADIPDSLHIIFPRGCAVEQVAIQNTRDFPEQSYYIVNNDLWEKMDANSQAGLILHEIIYREAIGFGHRDSIKVRYFNGMLATNQLSGMSVEQYVNFLERAGFPHTECFTYDTMESQQTQPRTVCFQYGSVTYDRSGVPTQGVLAVSQALPIFAPWGNRHTSMSLEFIGEVKLRYDRRSIHNGTSWLRVAAGTLGYRSAFDLAPYFGPSSGASGRSSALSIFCDAFPEDHDFDGHLEPTRPTRMSWRVRVPPRQRIEISGASDNQCITLR